MLLRLENYRRLIARRQKLAESIALVIMRISGLMGRIRDHGPSS
jgi:hypothetical protein